MRVIGAKQVDEYQVSLSEVVHSMFHQVVRGQTLLKVDSFFLFELDVAHLEDF